MQYIAIKNNKVILLLMIQTWETFSNAIAHISKCATSLPSLAATKNVLKSASKTAMASATVSIAVLKPSSHGLLDTDIIIKTAVLRLNVIFR